ncbi:MAG: hypothetical protein LBB55_01960, partial [Zoogloeaceae bacterium]|nr:hypothetical protein [Zoogloeaceae bacterium]
MNLLLDDFPPGKCFTRYGEGYVVFGETRFEEALFVSQEGIGRGWTRHDFATLDIADFSLLAEKTRQAKAQILLL